MLCNSLLNVTLLFSIFCLLTLQAKLLALKKPVMTVSQIKYNHGSSAGQCPI